MTTCGCTNPCSPPATTTNIYSGSVLGAQFVADSNLAIEGDLVTIPLTQGTPISKGSIHLFFNGVWQPHDDFDLVGDDIVLTSPIPDPTWRIDAQYVVTA